MLTNLQIRDFAIVDHINVEFADGMTVLTGETGAGKSILVDALGLVLGERGGSGLVRKGATRAEFAASFDLGGLPEVAALLEEKVLDSDGECLLRRVINLDGRSRAFINGNAVPLQTLKMLGEFLLDIHGQHFHQSLVKTNVQLALLDHFAGAQDLRTRTANAFADWRVFVQQLDHLRSAVADRNAQQDLLEFQTNELDSLNLQPDEYDRLSDERQKLQFSGKLAEGTAAIVSSIYDAEPGNAHGAIADAVHTIQTLQDMDESLAPIGNMLREAEIQVAEAAESLRRYHDSLGMDPAERDVIEQRLDVLQSTARKHRVQATELPDLLQALTEQLTEIRNAESAGQELEQQAIETEQVYRKHAKMLSAERHKAAIEFSDAVSDAMADLGMAGGRFEIVVTEKTAQTASASGLDDIEFLISANPGQAPQPLSKVASGGELSRMSLAIQVIAHDGSTIPTMIFDEVDSGVGGGVAEMVGKRLRELSAARQVLCVTHLPQVASLANQHCRVLKMSDGRSTRTGVSLLKHDERVEELARMLGGVEITDKTRAHAAEMLENGRKFAKNKKQDKKSA